MSNKLGFWSVFAMVTGSQIGSGIFMLPASLSAYGVYSILGWLIAGLGAIALALVFGGLCEHFPKTGGPHVYVYHAFGQSLSFFTGWTYWVISWVSTTAVVAASIGYLIPLLGEMNANLCLFLEIILLLSITGVNLRGVKTAGQAESILTILKFIPLLILPAIALFYYKSENFVISDVIEAQPLVKTLSQVTLLTLWGFIGLESATAAAGCVENPSKTIPKAIVLGTLCVVGLYLINSFGIMGLIPGPELASSTAPYVTATQKLFTGNWHIIVSLIASVVCIGTLNAWMLATSQVALGLAEDRLLPYLFSKKNKHDAPYLSLFMSCAGILALLILTSHSNLTHQITSIIDLSVIAFLFIYLICSLAFLKVLIQQKRMTVLKGCYTLFSIGFCSWILYMTPIKTISISSLFILSGFPAYLSWRVRSLRVKRSQGVNVRGNTDKLLKQPLD